MTDGTGINTASGPKIVEYFSGEQPEAKERGIAETGGGGGGIPTGVAFDIHRRIEHRRAKQVAED
jgi:hypothetical protein